MTSDESWECGAVGAEGGAWVTTGSLVAAVEVILVLIDLVVGVVRNVNIKVILIVVTTIILIVIVVTNMAAIILLRHTLAGRARKKRACHGEQVTARGCCSAVQRANGR